MPPLFLAAENGRLLACNFLVEEQGHDILALYAPVEVGFLAAIEAGIDSVRRKSIDVPPGHIACARWAREKGAVC